VVCLTSWVTTGKHVDECESDAGVLLGAAHPGAQLGPHRRRRGFPGPEAVGARVLVGHGGAEPRERVVHAPDHLEPHGVLDPAQPLGRARRLVRGRRDGLSAVAERAGAGRRDARGQRAEGREREVGGGQREARVAGVDGGRVRGQPRAAEARVERARAAAAHELHVQLLCPCVAVAGWRRSRRQCGGCRLPSGGRGEEERDDERHSVPSLPSECR
jgi:hypothetical protein